MGAPLAPKAPERNDFVKQGHENMFPRGDNLENNYSQHNFYQSPGIAFLDHIVGGGATSFLTVFNDYSKVQYSTIHYGTVW